MTKRVALYLRVSTDGQTTENQLKDLREVADRAGWTVVEVIEEAGISGSKGRDKRPGLDRLLRMVTQRKLDMVAAWSVDRLGRSLQDLVGVLNELHGPAAISFCISRPSTPPPAPGGPCSACWACSRSSSGR